MSVLKRKLTLISSALWIASASPGAVADPRLDTPAAAACIAIRTAADLNKIRANSFGNFCLAADIDLASIPNFTPIGQATPFFGTLDGRGHAIRNLKLRSAGRAGLFDRIGGFGPSTSVRNLKLINVAVVSTGGDETGGLAAILQGGTISDVLVSGAVSGTDTSSIGGLVGEQSGGAILRSSSWATVTARASGGLIGGLVGYQSKQAAILQSYATGPVTAGGFDIQVGGLVGNAEGIIRQSFASGPVTATATVDSRVGGLVGDAHPFSTPQSTTKGVFASFATGPVTSVVGSRDSYAGGLAGIARGFGVVEQAYAAGRISVDKPRSAEVGGLLGDDCDCIYVDVLRSYWNPQTTGLAKSDSGAPLSTSALQARLPNGFHSSVWGITPGVSFPYLKLSGLSFWSPLAITVLNDRIFTFLPLNQREKSEYSRPVRHADQAGLAAVYTMAARAIGTTKSIGSLRLSPIDDFWNDTTRIARFSGPITTYAALGALRRIAPTSPIAQDNIIGPLRSRRVVIIRGAASGRVLWMLATSFTTHANGKIARLVANDPWTGRQVQIDAATKKVVAPSDFPLGTFTVDGYRVLLIK